MPLTLTLTLTLTKVAQYSVQYSVDGGDKWVEGPAGCASSPCTLTGLPAGTTAVVRVAAWGEAGQGEDSDVVAAKTNDNEYSRECAKTLRAQADGSYVAPGTIVAACFGALAALLLCCGVALFMKNRQPPPPPPGAKPPPGY